MAKVAIVTDTTHYLPRELVGGERDPPGQPLRPLAGARRPRGRPPGLRRLLRAPAHRRPTCRRRRSPPSATSSPSTSRCSTRGTTSSPSISSAGSPAPTTRRSPPRPASTSRAGRARIEVVDSATACGGLGLVALAAAAGGRAGEDVEAVVRRAKAARERLNLWFCIDTLEFLRRGGRIGAASAWLGHDAEDQAHPQGRGPDHARGARAHVEARVRADGGLPAQRPRGRR